jgi:hypothetical protein
VFRIYRRLDDFENSRLIGDGDAAGLICAPAEFGDFGATPI